MNKQITPLMGISHLLNSPLVDFVDTFFNNSLPISLVERTDSYPKYNIVCNNPDSKDEFTVELAVAGFGADDLEVFTEEGTLHVNTKTQESSKEEVVDTRKFLHRGIAARSFQWQMELPQYADVTSTELLNGILSINIKIKVPKEKQPVYHKIITD